MPDSRGAHLEDPARVAAWRRVLLRKGGAVASALESLLAGKEVDLQSLSVFGKVDDNTEQRLRLFLERIDRGIKAVGTVAFGRCRVCQAALPAASLDETPWLERCAAHPEATG